MSSISYFPVLDNLNQKYSYSIKFFCIFGKDGGEVIFNTNDDKTYAVGNNVSGCLGVGHNKAVQEPEKVHELCDQEIIDIAYGIHHVLALSKNGKCFSWGNNKYGQLGHGCKKKYMRPKLIEALNFEPITQVKCSDGFSAILTKTGKIFCFGYNADGRLGCGNNEDQLSTIEVKKFTQEKIISISCGRAHALALTKNGHVYSWGDNGVGQLGVGDNTFRNAPTLIKLDDSVKIRIINACYWYSLVLSFDGVIFAFGDNSEGQLGNGNNTQQNIPIKISCSFRIKEIASYFDNNISIAISENNICLVWGQTEKGSFNRPQQVSNKTLDEAFAEYALIKTTYKPVWLNEIPEFSEYEQNSFDRKQLTPRIYKILGEISNLFNQQDSSDLRFKVDGQNIYAHKIILRTCSEYFSSKFGRSLNTMRESSENRTNALTIDEIVIEKYSYEVFYAYIKYIYTDSIDIETENVMDLLILAKSYSEFYLEERCREIIQNELNVENFCILFSKSNKYELNELEDYCFDFALKRLNEICGTQAFKEMDEISSKKFMLKVAEKRAFK